MLFLIQKYYLNIQKLLNNRNSLIFIWLLLYIYLSSAIVYFFALQNTHITVVFSISISLLLLQIIFSIFTYLTVVRIQREILTQREQKEQKLQLKLEMQHLQEYTNYLDENEDDLRRFKHDYQNILNGLKVSVQEGNTNTVIKKLDEYTHTQFNQKALRKYKGVNHVNEKNLKSIVIAKLSKLYSTNIDYSFDCRPKIYNIPKSVDIFDLVRIIGIAFDNAIEESLALIKDTGKKSAQVDAMYYQEDGDFEFEIRNRVRHHKLDTNKISERDFTTKKNHMGLGLANVKKIAHKYENVMIINYFVSDGWFTFDLTILPDDGSR